MSKTEKSAVQKLSAVIIEDHPVFRDGLTSALRLDPRIELVGQFEDGIHGLQAVRKLHPNILLLDINLPRDMNGIEVLRVIRQERIPTRVIVLTAHHDIEQTLTMIRSGANAYAAKDVHPDELIKMIDLVVKGYSVINGKRMTPQQTRMWTHQQLADLAGPYPDEHEHYVPLSPREMEILRFVTQGMSNKAIAYELQISQQTVKNHMTAILRKLNVEDRTQAAITAIRRGWVRIQD